MNRVNKITSENKYVMSRNYYWIVYRVGWECKQIVWLQGNSDKASRVKVKESCENVKAWNKNTITACKVLSISFLFCWMSHERKLYLHSEHYCTVRLPETNLFISLCLSWSGVFFSEHPLVILAHGASVLPPGPGVVWHDARVPLESHHPDRERWPRGPCGAEEAGDAPGGERDEGERSSATRGSFLQRVHRMFCVCVCSCNRQLRGSSLCTVC